MRKLGLALFFGVSLLAPAQAQPFQPPFDAVTLPLSGTVTTGLTYQLLLSAVANVNINQAPPNYRHSLTVQNNTVATGAVSTDLCYLIIAPTALASQITAGTSTTSSTATVNGKTITLAQASIVLSGGGSYGRYYPLLPSDTLFITCATTGDSFYADIQ